LREAALLSRRRRSRQPTLSSTWRSSHREGDRGGAGSCARPRYGVWCLTHALRSRGRLTDGEDIANVAGQLADLTHTVEEMGSRLENFRLKADTQQERADVQQERIDLAARELAEVSERLQAAAKALRQAI